MALESGRELARRITVTLQSSGYVAYWVGGCVRDELLGLLPTDFDVATSAVPEEILGLFPDAELIGASFGVVQVRDGATGGVVEVATFRSESGYRDGRHPEQVRYEKDASLDASRRDFTINALFYDPVRDEVIDFVGGREDLRAGIVRAIGEARERFDEDHLRLLRAVRFAARFGYEIEAKTLEALRELAPKIVRIAGERLHDEMSLILTSANRGPALQMLRETGLLRVLLPELPEGRGTRLALLREPVSMPLAWAALLEGVSDVAGVMRRFRFSHVEAEQCLKLLRGELQFGRVNEMPVAELKRFLRMANFAEQLELHRASREAQGEGLATYEHVHGLLAQWSAEELRPLALLSGDDLLELGLLPGPRFREILNRVEDSQLEGRITTREEAIELALAQGGGDVHG